MAIISWSEGGSMRLERFYLPKEGLVLIAGQDKNMTEPRVMKRINDAGDLCRLVTFTISDDVEKRADSRPMISDIHGLNPDNFDEIVFVFRNSKKPYSEIEMILAKSTTRPV